MFSTTTLLAVQMVYVKRLPVIVAVGFFVVFGFLDGEAHRILLPLRCLIRLGRACRILSLGLLGSGLRFLKSS
jgi:hypothetical protein